MNSKTLTVSIKASPKKVFEFASKPENMPKWAQAFCKSIKMDGNAWRIETPMGPAKVRFVTDAKNGVLDHYVEVAPGVTVYVPMRVVANGKDSEVIFTLFQLPSMADDKFAEDIHMVEQDLSTLKKCCEG
ncbi:MAG: hypothetical protein A2901_07500 [Elusimicrobia bacterium RIFCSPLOWO2_01_FULL_54_10]|nr:MAG: hypothetical protein A2901_07500 [Elusimicrobia bacterium RIFCSPLOWO2_01_FULL_54_10]